MPICVPSLPRYFVFAASVNSRRSVLKFAKNEPVQVLKTSLNEETRVLVVLDWLAKTLVDEVVDRATQLYAWDVEGNMLRVDELDAVANKKQFLNTAFLTFEKFGSLTTQFWNSADAVEFEL